MSRKIEIRQRAAMDLYHHYRYIARDKVDAADRLLLAFHDATAKLVDMPGMGPAKPLKNPRLRGLRFWPIKGFRNYLIFYKPTENGIEVVRLLHGARDIERVLGDDLP